MNDLISTSNFLAPGDVFVNQTVASASEVIGLLADHLHQKGKVKASYRLAVEQREQQMPTGLPLEDGLAVAVPHTDPEHVLQSGLAVATLAEPVIFRSMDDPDNELSVRMVFMMALRSKEEQLDMLIKIGKVLQNQAVLERLLDGKTGAEIARQLDQFLS